MPRLAGSALLRLARMPTPPPPRPRRDLWPIAVSAVVALAYAGGHLAWYRHTPLGQVPVLDEQENLAFAEMIVRGELPHEPFYRAPGYALMLAAIRMMGVPVQGIFATALTLGVALHAINAALVARIARIWFGGSAAAWAAGLLFALNPVMVHYATQALDAVPALTFFLLGLAFVARAFVEEEKIPPWTWAAASVMWAVATICRPNYLALWCALPLLALWRPAPRWPRAAAALLGAVVFAGVAAWQARVSGEAGFLPWQGPYNLWAANQPGTHGRYYVQREKLPAGLQQNPARAESIFLFRQEKGHAPADPRELNAHWRAKFFAHLAHHPLEWSGLLARKSYALLNNWEQYNNKTFSFHQARSPWLRWNFLGFGVLLGLAVAGTARLAAISRRTAVMFAVVAVVCSGSVLLFFVSARFRLPLAALATIAAGGALAAPRFWLAWPRGRKLALAGAVAAALALAFSRFDGVADRGTTVEDYALSARAAATTGDDALAWTEANAALALQPAHPDALRLAVATYFNELVIRGPDARREVRWQELCARFLESGGSDAGGLRAVAVVGLWRAQRQPEALAEWRNLPRSPSAMAARVLVGDPRVAPRDLLGAPADAWEQALFRLAAVRFNLRPPAGEAAGDPKAASEVIQRIFGEPGR